MPATLISIDRFREAMKAGIPARDPVFRLSTEPALDVDGADRTLRFVFSDGSVDRMGDTIAADGWQLAEFERNPVALWAHDSSAPPIGGARNVVVEGARLMGDIEFAPPETYQFADTIYRLVRGKFIRAVSVGFMPTRYAFVDNDPERGWGIDFLEQSLLEISVCPVPANANALAEARRKGIDTRPLTDWAERLRKAAMEPKMARKPGTQRRAGGASEEDPPSGGDIVGDCGRPKDETCGMKDPQECSVHAKAKADPIDPDDEKGLLRALRRLFGGKWKIVRAGDTDDTSEDEPPIAHEDAIRLAHKSLRTSKAFLTDAVSFHAKAMSLLDGVVDALDEGEPQDDGNPEVNPDTDTPEAQAARAAKAEARRLRLAA
jgi:HK97 family phage prohead protease